MTHEHGALFHCDEAQMVGKICVNVDELGFDLFSMSAHKLYGPKGVGALICVVAQTQSCLNLSGMAADKKTVCVQELPMSLVLLGLEKHVRLRN